MVQAYKLAVEPVGKISYAGYVVPVVSRFLWCGSKVACDWHDYKVTVTQSHAHSAGPHLPYCANQICSKELSQGGFFFDFMDNLVVESSQGTSQGTLLGAASGLSGHLVPSTLFPRYIQPGMHYGVGFHAAKTATTLDV